MSLEKYLPKIRRRIPGYRFSWEILTEIILENVATKPHWLDIGAGRNYLIAEQPGAKLAVGLDSIRPDILLRNKNDFYCLGKAEQIPFRGDTFDFITSRFAFEHLRHPEKALAEASRVLKPGGTLVIQTTNVKSPIIMASRIIPFRLKKRTFKTLFKENPSGTFKTYYRINRPERFEMVSGSLKLEKLIMVGDILCHNYPLYAFSMGLNRLLSNLHLERWRDNIIAVYKKEA